MTPFETRPSDRKNKKPPENTWNSLNTYQKLLLLTTTLFIHLLLQKLMNTEFRIYDKMKVRFSFSKPWFGIYIKWIFWSFKSIANQQKKL